MPNLTYAILQNAKHLIACPCTGRVDPCVPISSSVVMGVFFTAPGVSVTAEENQYLFILHNSVMRKLTSRSSSPEVFCWFYNQVTIVLENKQGIKINKEGKLLFISVDKRK